MLQIQIQDDDAADSNPQTDSGAGFASSTTKAGAPQGTEGSGSGVSKAGSADMLTKAQLQGAARLLKGCLYSHGMEASVMCSAPQLPTRRQLFTAVYRAINDMSNQNDAVERVIH